MRTLYILAALVFFLPFSTSAQTLNDATTLPAPLVSPDAAVTPHQTKAPPRREKKRIFKSNEILVELKTDNARVLTDPQGDEALASVYREFGAPRVEPLFKKGSKTATWDAHREAVRRRFPARAKRSQHKITRPPGRFFKLSFAVTDTQLADIAERLQTSPNLRSVSLNGFMQASAIPNDTYWGTSGAWGQSEQDLWGLYKIMSSRTWRSGATGDSGIIVAVVDSGLDATHADIVDNLYSNPAETAGDGVDNDGNGYVDDAAGWDFFNSDNDPTDDYYHGTHVAGTIAATGNNATGITGVMWDAQILPVKALDADGNGSYSAIANAVTYAADQGADVINMSLGGSDSSTIEAAVEYAYSLGVVIVAAAGNDRTDAMDQAPAMYDEVITVASSSPDDELSSFSNFGPKIDVTAPGEDILSLLASGGSISSSSSDIVGTNYYVESGTSMAAPHVSGVAGLLLASDPTLTNEEVRQAIRQTVDIASPGWDEETGNGLLNAFRAVTKPTQCEALITDPDHYGEITDNVTVTGDAGGADFARYRVDVYQGSTRVAGMRPLTTAVSDNALGTLNISGFTSGNDYSVQLTVYDSAGKVCGRDRRETTGSYTLGTYDTAGYARDADIVGNYAYVADWTSGLLIFDISAPSSPTLVGSYDTSGSATRVIVSGNYAYVADVGSGLQIIDVSTPSSPTLAGSYDTSGAAYGLALAGNYAYVADRTAGLVIIDVSTPSAPTLAGSYDTSGYAVGVDVSGNYAYVADYDYGLQILDVSTPSSPTLVATYDTSGNAEKVDVSGDYAYVADSGSGLQVIDVSTPSSPSLYGSWDTYTAYDVTVDGDYAYVSDGNSGLLVMDVSVPSVPFTAVTYDTPGKAYAAAVSSGLAVVADNDEGIQIISLTAPASDNVTIDAGTYDTPGFAYAMDREGDYAYVADGSYGLQILDISTPANPTLEGSYNTSGNSYGVDVSGDYAYVADQSSGLQIIDVSTPSSPALVGGYNSPGNAMDVTVNGNYAYLADYSSGIQIIDVSTPSSPTLVGTYDTAGSAYSVTVDGNYAYVADGDSGLVILDISTPSSPTLVGSLDTDGQSRAVAIDGGYAFIADNTAGLQIIDVSTPSAPVLAANYPTEDYTLNVLIVDSYAYMTDGYSGLHILDVSTPTSPEWVITYDTAGFGFETVTDGTYAYIADWSAGMQVVYVRLR